MVGQRGNVLGKEYFRPGGLKLTDELLAQHPLARGAQVLDIGCGSGATVYHMRDQYGYDAKGIDMLLPCAENELLKAGDAHALPYENNSFDAVLYECSFSKFTNPAQALLEAARVLKPGGVLLISDLYAQGEETTCAGALGRLEKKENIAKRFLSHCFSLLYFEDHHNELVEYWGQLLLANGASTAQKALGAERGTLKKARCSYYIAIWRYDG